MMKETAASPAAVSSCRKSLFATTRHLSELQKALKDGDHHRAGHPSRVSRTHPSAPLTKGSRSFGWPRNRRISCGGFVVSKKPFRHGETFFKASKSSEKWGSSSCRTPFPGFPHTPFRPIGERLSLWGQTQGIPAAKAAGIPFSSSFLRSVPPEGRFLRKI